MISEFTIAGKQVSQPNAWDDVSINLDYNSNGLDLIQPVLSVENLTFTGDARKVIKEEIRKSGLFYRIPIKISNSLFDGYLSDFVFLEDTAEVTCKLNQNDGFFTLSEQLSSMTTLVLQDKYKLQEFQFIVEKTDEQSKSDLALLSFMISSATITSLQASQTLLDYYTQLAFPDVLDPLNPVEKATRLFLFLIYLIALGGLWFNIFREIQKLVLPFRRKSKAVSLGELVRVPLNELGYNFITDITDIDECFVWASRNTKKQRFFLPNQNDNCYRAIEVFNFIADKYDGRFYFDGKSLFFYNRLNPFWETISEYELPQNFPLENYRYNLDEHNVAYEISYATDIMDAYTYDNYDRTSILISSQLADFTRSTAKGFKRVQYPFALATKKDSLSLVEKSVDSFRRVIQKLLSLVGGGKSLSWQNPRTDLYKISQETFSTAKLIRLNGSKAPANYRDKLNAENDWNMWQSSQSWVQNPNNLKRLYENSEIPFNFGDFEKLLLSGKFKGGKFRNIEWQFNRATATATIEQEDDQVLGLIETKYISNE